MSFSRRVDCSKCPVESFCNKGTSSCPLRALAEKPDLEIYLEELIDETLRERGA